MAKQSLAAAEKAKQKKQKVILAVGGVLLLALLAFQAPKVLAMMNAKPPALPPGAVVQPPNGFPAPAAGAPLAAPTLSGTSPTASGAVSGDGIVDASAISAAPASGQLVSFGRFASKDPFAPQVETHPGAGVGDTGSSGGSTPKPVPPVGPLGPGAGPTPPPVAGPLPTTALISINGVPEIVALGKDFPAAEAVFHLVALTRTTAKIAIAGGSYADGAATVTLTKGKSLTLENTADGSRYVLRLLALDPPVTAVPTAAIAPATSTTQSATQTTTTSLTP
jgi:hypothetical protein